MSRTSQNVQVGKRKIELSNLEKVLFPEDHVLKAELIQYYLTIAPTILAHIKGRPLSLVRYPDGIHGERFFQKNRPEWAPEWIDHIKLGEKEEKIDYIMANEDATLVWLANLACIELHQMHSHQPHFDAPDYMVFDLDPPENYSFPQLIEIALQFKEHLEGYGYHPFVKTTGKKGLHIQVPVEPKWSFKQVFEAASEIAKPFVESHPLVTLHIKKEARKGRVLMDIYRNRQYQTIVSPFSVRGVPGAPVSMPLSWEELPEIKDTREFNIHTVPEKVLKEGNPWEAFAAYAEPLHTEKKGPANIKEVAPARTYKSPEKLESYAQKRDFTRTREPAPEVAAGYGNGFVVHRHHASRLHYDLRLEQEGTLKSWAVPKGLPPEPGIKRLAVAVEDHPLKYLTFEGEIPKGEYGGGMMWIYALGKYEITKEKKTGFYFRLMSRELNGEYRIHRTKDNEWLLERVDKPQLDWLHRPIEPMLAEICPEPPKSGDYFFEVKWDGIRAIVSINEGEMKIYSRNGRDITRYFPELIVPEQAFRATAAVFDGEIVCLGDDGRPNFKNVIHRIQQNTDGAIERAKSKYPAVCYLFDCLYLDGRPVTGEPLWRRREWLADALRKNTPFRLSEVMEDGVSLFEAAKKLELEGIVAKDPNSTYLPGKRSSTWLKIKTRQTAECLIIGYTEGKGSRESSFGALHLATTNGKGMEYRGKVGTGWDTRMQKQIYSELKKLKRIERPVKEKPLDDSKTVWIEPKIACEIQYAACTDKGTFRAPVFVRLRPDLVEK